MMLNVCKRSLWLVIPHRVSSLDGTVMMKVSVLVLAFVLAGATVEAADVKVTFLSDPPGAVLYSEEVPGSPKQWGYTPYFLKFSVPKKWSECSHTPPLRVRWLSGAEASIEALTLCPEFGKNQQFTFMRPSGAPGAEVDGQFAILLLQQQASAPPPPAYIPPPVEPVRLPTHCTSTVIGTQIFTNCY
jgi:hypothetical protein